MTRHLARLAAVALTVGFLGLCVVWRMDGGRWERVETPSMGTVAPVGTLLWVTPVDFDSLQPGDFITFRPPGRGQTYSHRVLARERDGTITTKGMLSSADPWRLTADDVVGKVRMRWWGAGWIVKAAPLLLAGAVLVALAARAASARWKLPVLLVLGAAVVSLAIAWYRPFVNAEQISFAPAPRGGADATYVGTGLLPIRLTAADGGSVVMHAGEVGTVHVAQSDARHRFRVTLRPALPWWWWLVVTACCFAPAAAASASRRSRGDNRSAAVGPAAADRPHVPAASRAAHRIGG